MTPGEVTVLVGMLAASFPGSRMARDTVEVYKQLLSDLDCDVATQAVKRLACTARFLPTIAEIREACVAIEDGPPPTALEQWGIVGHACASDGYYSPAPTFKDETTNRCVRAMGWRYLCRSGYEAADRARFIELYRELNDRRQTARQTGELPALQDVPHMGEARALPQKAPPSVMVAALTDEQAEMMGQNPAARIEDVMSSTNIPARRPPLTQEQLEDKRQHDLQRLADWAKTNEQTS